MPNEIVRRQNKQTVLRQAMKLFSANGVENTSGEMIARKSNLTLRSIQNYYKTKNDLIAAVLENGYAAELREMKLFFASERYQSKAGADQIMAIVATAMNKAVEHPDIIFCTAQMQHILSRASERREQQLSGNWLYVMEHLQNAFNKGMADGSITKAMEEKLIDVKSIMLALRGIQEQVAFTMRDKALNELFEPQNVVKKYICQMELMLSGKHDV